MYRHGNNGTTLAWGEGGNCEQGGGGGEVRLKVQFAVRHLSPSDKDSQLANAGIPDEREG
jgi:hypothetical protein